MSQLILLKLQEKMIKIEKQKIKNRNCSHLLLQSTTSTTVHLPGTAAPQED